MKKRAVSAAVLIPILVLVVFFAPKNIGAVIMALMLGISAYELLYRTKFVVRPRLVAYSVVMAFGVGLWSFYGAGRGTFLLLSAGYFLLLFIEMMIDHIKVRLEQLGICFIAGLIIPYFLSSLLRIFATTNGRYMIVIPLLVAFASDAGAYFVGVKFGRHKLAPVVSPNKTIEGLLGGLASGLLGMLLYGLILQLFLGFQVNFLLTFVYGLLGAGIGTMGDLCFSTMKRQAGLKDFGNLIPGHGGALDRLDSLTLVAPLMEALLLLAPIVE